MKIKLNRTDFFNIVILFIISCLFVLDLFVNKGQPASFDEPTHLANIAMFYKSMKTGDLHVTWTDGFANYGMPIGLIAQQTTSYLGGFINFLVHNVVISYNLVVLIGAFFSTLFFYWFLRLYFKPESSLLGAFLFHFAPYRIINVYIRGDVPEFFASIFLPLILLGMYFFVKRKNLIGLLVIVISTTLLILTHPMMVIIYAFIIGPYGLYILYKDQYFIKKSIMMGAAFVGGVMLSGYYIVPLVAEVRYFYYGLEKNHLKIDNYLTLANFIDPRWYYFYKNDIFPRGHFLKTGIVEMFTLLAGALYLCVNRVKKHWISLLSISLGISVVTMLLMTKYAEPLFLKINFLGNVQHQWRLLSAFIFLPAIIITYLTDRAPKILIIAMIIIIALFSFSQLYGKNYTIHPDASNYFTLENLHGNIMNTIWTGPTQDYPVRTEKPGIIEGKGTVLSQSVQNSVRKYQINANTDVRMADYTFYFPGWKVFVDNQPVVIQFQDPAYRGVITYNVPKGTHSVVVKFTDTKYRLLGNLVSFVSLVVLFGIIITRRSLSKIYDKK